jgi:hypothetical protein
MTGDSPQRDWYSGYRGVGAEDPARKERVMDANR